MSKSDRNGRNQPGGWEVADALLEHVAVLDQNGYITAVNASWRRFAAENGTDPAKVSEGVNYLDFCKDSNGVPLPEADAVLTGLTGVLDGTLDRFSFEYPCHSPEVHRWFRMNATPLSNGRGAVLSHVDVTETRLNEEAAHQSRTLFSDIIEGTTDAVFLCATDGRLLLVNSALAQWLGKPADEIIGKKVNEIGPDGISRIVLEHNAEIVAGKKTRTFEVAVPTGRQGSRTFLVTKGLNRSREGDAAIFGIARDVSELKMMEREIIDTSEKEKQRLGHDLHENLCQYLVGISLLGNVLFEDLLRLGIKQAEDARQITGLVKDVVTEVRTMVKGLSPMPLDQGDGLVVALEELADQARSIGNIECTVRASRSTKGMERSITLPLYRIAQEAVHNAIKHSQATKLQIRLSNSRDSIVLTIQDDGIGFPEPKSLNPKSRSGLGLDIMNYRSRIIGAELMIRKLPKGGTAVICTIPKRVGRKRASPSRKRAVELSL